MTPEVRLPDLVSKISCSLNGVTQRIATQSYLDLNLTTVVRDAAGTKLNNFSSVHVSWSLSDPRLAHLDIGDGVLTETTEHEGGFLINGKST